MRHTPERHRDAADRTVKDIRRKTRKRYTSEDKIRIVLAGLGGEDTIAELCRQEGISLVLKVKRDLDSRSMESYEISQAMIVVMADRQQINQASVELCQSAKDRLLAGTCCDGLV